jgi:ureidoglycolate dehydrogenase (NAD+)
MVETFEGVRCPAADLTGFIEDLFTRAGADAPSAKAVTKAVVDASARAFDTHGVRLVPHYIASIEGGRVTGKPRVTFTRKTPSVGHVDGGSGFGHLASYRAIEEGCAMATETGVAAITAGNSSHHGATGCYTAEAARRGFAAIGVTHADAMVVPHGGVKAFYGTNPFSFALPVPGEEPMVLDMATSSIPFNRVFLRRATGTPLPPDVAVTGTGEPTTDANATEAVLPLGGAGFGYKGAGLAAMVDLLSSAFTGMPHGFRLPSFSGPDFATPIPMGHFFLVLRPETFQPAESFYGRVTEFLSDLRNQPTRPGEKVMAPSDPEKPEAADRARRGILVDLTTWDALKEIAGRYRATVPKAS